MPRTIAEQEARYDALKDGSAYVKQEATAEQDYDQLLNNVCARVVQILCAVDDDEADETADTDDCTALLEAIEQHFEARRSKTYHRLIAAIDAHYADEAAT